MSAVPTPIPAQRERALTIAAAVLAALLLYVSWRRYVDVDLEEAFGLVSGAACVWLGVKQNIWNWPIGIANNVVYVIIFGAARLFADAGLQVVFAVVGAYGWYSWARRGTGRTQLAIGRASRAAWIGALSAVTLSTALLAFYLAHVADAAPFLDALTTTLSLAAMAFMTRKYVECWWLWTAINVISIGLYAFKHLALTALLYAVYLVMCIVGLRMWSESLRAAEAGR